MSTAYPTNTSGHRLNEDAGLVHPLTEAEIEELLLYLLRCPKTCEFARDLLDVVHFGEYRPEMRLVWGAALDLMEIHGPSIVNNPLPVRNECIRQIEEGLEELDEHERQWLFGEDADPENDPPPDSDEKIDATRDGFLVWAYATDPSTLSESRGNDLLRRFLNDRFAESMRGQLESRTFMAADLRPIINEFQRRTEEIEQIGQPQLQPLADCWGEHDRWLEKYRGRSSLGLETGMRQLDQRTLGLRDLVLLGAGPGVGKTALAIDLGIGVCSNYANNDAVVVFFSLEMDKNTIISRIKCNLGDLDYSTLMFGSLGLREGQCAPTNERQRQGQAVGQPLSNSCHWFSERDQQRLESAERRARDEQISRRMMIVDRKQVGDNLTASWLAGIVRQYKESVGASRALVIVDYLQVLPISADVESRCDLMADRSRVQLLQDVLEEIRTDDDSDCVLAISEARKPSNAKEKWGNGLAELMGSARLGYAAGTVLLYSGMSPEHIKQQYGLTNEDPEQVRESMIAKGRSPIELTLVKGRDGMTRGTWGLEYEFHKTRFRERNVNGIGRARFPLPDPEPEGGPSCVDDGCGQGDQVVRNGESDGTVLHPEFVLPTRTPRKKKAKKKAADSKKNGKVKTTKKKRIK